MSGDKRNTGLIGKYRVERLDGKPVDWAPLTTDELDTIRALLDDGAPAKEAARTVGCSDRTVRKHFPGRGWTARQTAEFVGAVRQARRAVA